MSLCEGYHFLHRVFDQAQVVSKLVCRHCVLDRELSVRTMLDFLRLDAIAYPGHADGGFFVFFSGWVHEPSVETGSRSRRRDRRGRTRRPGRFFPHTRHDMSWRARELRLWFLVGTFENLCGPTYFFVRLDG